MGQRGMIATPKKNWNQVFSTGYPRGTRIDTSACRGDEESSMARSRDGSMQAAVTLSEWLEAVVSSANFWLQAVPERLPIGWGLIPVRPIDGSH